MPVVLEKSMAVRWLLKEVMDRYRVSNAELAEKLGKHATAISRLRSHDNLPAIGGAAIEELANAITKLLRERGLTDSISSRDLIGFDD